MRPNYDGAGGAALLKLAGGEPGEPVGAAGARHPAETGLLDPGAAERVALELLPGDRVVLSWLPLSWLMA